jgi:dihydropteroate synthase
VTMDSLRSAAPATEWLVRGRSLSLDRPIVMGVLNVTPDSFSDGGRFTSMADSVAHGERLLDEGADIVDIGGESTRPGAQPVPLDEELSRVLPVLAELRRRRPGALFSVDTVKGPVAAAAVDAGAHIVNDVSGLRLDPSVGVAAAGAGAGLILMHSRGGVSAMAGYELARYDGEVMAEVLQEMEAALSRAGDAGVPPAAVAVDPGLGFAKEPRHSLAVLRELPRLVALGHPVVVGASRKRFIGEITGVGHPHARLAGTLGAIVMALARGARIFRVHDAAAARQALDVAWTIALGEGGG